jgi:hypothetical protein
MKLWGGTSVIEGGPRAGFVILIGYDCESPQGESPQVVRMGLKVSLNRIALVDQEDVRGKAVFGTGGTKVDRSLLKEAGYKINWRGPPETIPGRDGVKGE